MLRRQGQQCTAAKSRGRRRRKSSRESFEERDLRSLQHQLRLPKVDDDDGKDVVVVVAMYYIKKTFFREHTIHYLLFLPK